MPGSRSRRIPSSLTCVSDYSSSGALPLIPGIDGVGRSEDGLLRYFVALDGGFGTIADQTVIDSRRTVVLADDADVATIAAAMNPGMSAWVALRRRIALELGQSVLVLGATGGAGRMAVQIAKLLGAGHVAAAGRNAARQWPRFGRDGRHRRRAAGARGADQRSQLLRRATGNAACRCRVRLAAADGAGPADRLRALSRPRLSQSAAS
jgi:NADPH:quinone reductase-like Zn-dependent oxidoreductase